MTAAELQVGFNRTGCDAERRDVRSQAERGNEETALLGQDPHQPVVNG